MVDIVDLRNLVAEAEGTTDARASQENFASGYDVPFAYGQYLQPSKPISQMTFQELRDFQRRQVNATKGTFNNTNEGTSAVGRYQFIGSTLENLKNRLGYKDTDVFSPEVQDRLFDALMEEQGLQDLSAGLITPEKFQEKLSSQFASIPKPGTETGTYKGQGTGVTSDRVSAVLSSMQADTQTDQMLSEEQPGGTFRPEDDTVPSDTGAVTSYQAEEEPGFLDTVGEYVSDAYDTVSEYAGETVNTLERVAESVGEKLRRLLGSEEEQSNTSVDNPPIPEPRPNKLGQPPIPQPRPSQTKTPSFNVADAARDVYSLAATGGSRASARKLRDMVAQQLGVYESSQEATSEAEKYGLNEREVDTLRHILGAGLLKYIGKDFTQPLLQGTELFEKIPIYAKRLLDPNSEDKYRKSYYDQSIEEANIDIVNYQVGAALAKQFDKKDDFINYAVQLVKDLGEGKTPVVLDKMPTRFGLVDRELTPRLSTGVIYPPEELERRNLTYNPDRGTLTAPPVEDYGFVEPAPGSKQADVDFSDVVDFVNTLKKAEGGSVEKKVKFVKEDDDDDVPDPPPGATPEEVADDIPAYLSTGEYVLPANVVRYIGLKNITGMHQRALAELQQMEDLDIIENVDENGYVEEDDDEMDYMKPEGVVEIVVAEHHPKGLMAKGFAEGGMINSDSFVEEGQVLPTSDIFSEGVYAQANVDRSVDSEDVVESNKVITAPIAFSSAPGKTAYLAYITPEEAASLRQAKQGFSSEGNGQEVSEGQYQHLGPKGLMSFNGVGGPSDPMGGDDPANNDIGDPEDVSDPFGGAMGGSDPMGGDDPANNDIGDQADVSNPFGGAMGGNDSDVGDGHGGGSREYEEDLEPEEVEEEKPTDPYEGYTYVKGIGYVPTSRRATSIKSASLSSIFTPGFLGTIGLMDDPNKEL
jgi:hypothetical protein